MTDLEDLYREIILDHYRSPRNRGELEAPPAHRVEGFNPLCGDEVVLTLLVDDGRVADIKFAGSGCSISQSSASLMSAAVKGKPLSEVRALIDTFKAMMSIHQSSLASQAGDAAEGPGISEDPAAAPGDRVVATSSSPDADDAARDDLDDAFEPEPVDPEALGELAALQGVVKFPVRIKCATLSWNALVQGLEELAQATP